VHVRSTALYVTFERSLCSTGTGTDGGRVRPNSVTSVRVRGNFRTSNIVFQYFVVNYAGRGSNLENGYDTLLDNTVCRVTFRRQPLKRFVLM